MTVAPYGTWASPISAELAAANTGRPSFPTVAGASTFWVEMRPSERGRSVLVQASAGSTPVDVLPPHVSVRTLVHEYGGHCYAVDGPTIYYVDFDDQRIYRYQEGSEPVSITPAPPAPRAWRYGDLVVVPGGSHLVCVRERHAEDGGVTNDLVAITTDGTGEPLAVAGGHDFYLSPTLDAAGERLAFVAWDLPRMPWDGTFLYAGSLSRELELSGVRLVAGREDESVVEPRWSPDGRLHYVSDRSGWWNLYVDAPDLAEALAPGEAEFALPAWQLGQHSYDFVPDGSIVARWRRDGTDHLGVVAGGVAREIETPFTAIHAVEAAGDRAVLVAGSGLLDYAVVSVDLASGEVMTLSTQGPPLVDPGYISIAQPVDPPLAAGGATHALYYAPRNADFEAPDGELPPLIVLSHGGPTSAFFSVLDWMVQYFTTRGFAVVQVNYGGSIGYGRAYRERLAGQWGVVDLDDCVATALWLAANGLADRRRLLVRGGSAGGYTTLCALTFRGDVFAAGASLYGVADLAALARDTHKFEAGYMDSLIGPWPQAQATYEERSPIFHTDLLRTPTILFQGLEDKVVPPAQAEAMAEALRAKGVPFAYIAFEGEQHGIRQAANVARMFEAELAFYGAVLGFEPAGDLGPLSIENDGALPGR